MIRGGRSGTGTIFSAEVIRFVTFNRSTIASY